jgi:predicted CopG family antitoxin
MSKPPSHTFRVDQKVYDELKRLQRIYFDRSLSDTVRRLLKDAGLLNPKRSAGDGKP